VTDPAATARRSTIAALGWVPFAVVALIQIASKLTGPEDLERVTKALCMPLLAVAAVVVLVAAGRRPASIVVVALLGLALLSSWLGDVLIDGSIAAGLGSFLAAHVAWLALFLLAFRRRISWWALLLVPWYAALVILLAPTAGALLVPVLVYGIALGGMAATATRGNRFTIAGGILFVVSDTVLALQLFTGIVGGRTADFVVMLTYLAAQTLLVLGVLARLVAWPMASSSGSAPGTSRTRSSRASRSPG
jgi:uncharacterized membrane protein YhhN